MPRGCMVVLVGGGDKSESVVDVRMPCVRALLEAVQRVFMFDQKSMF